MATQNQNRLRGDLPLKQDGAVPRLVWAVAIGYFLFFTFISYFLYNNLLYTDQDLAIHAQTMWNLLHGCGMSSILGVHFFANHFTPIFYLLRYVYALFADPLWLLVWQSAALASTGVILFGVARHYLSRWWAIFIVLAYYFYPPVGFTNIYEFHQTTLALPFTMLMVLGFIKRRYGLFLISALAAMTFQENIPLGVFVMAVLAYFEKRSRRWTYVPGIFSAAWLAASMVWIQPWFNQGKMQYFLIYSHFGSSGSDIVKKILLEPWVLVGFLLSASNVIYVMQLFAPLLFLPFAAANFLCPAIPYLFQHLLSSRLAEKTITYHYATEMIPFLFWSTAAGMAAFLTRYREKLAEAALMVMWIASIVVTSITMSPLFASMGKMESYVAGQRLKFDQSLMRKIPAAAPVVATFKFMPKLSQRAELYSFNHVYMGAYTLSTKSYALPETTRYALIDFSDEKMLACKNAQSQSHIKNFIENSPWQVLDFGMDTVLMIKGSKRDLSPLFEVNPSALNGPDKSFKAYTADRQIKFEGFSMRMGQGDHADQIGITFYWKALKKPTVNYDLLLTLVDSSGKTVYEYHHPIGYRIRPATDWQRSDRVAEHFWFCLPAGLPARPVEMRIGLGDTDKKQIVPFTGPLKGQLDPQGRARLDTLEPS